MKKVNENSSKAWKIGNNPPIELEIIIESKFPSIFLKNKKFSDIECRIYKISVLKTLNGFKSVFF